VRGTVDGKEVVTTASAIHDRRPATTGMHFRTAPSPFLRVHAVCKLSTRRRSASRPNVEVAPETTHATASRWDSGLR